MIKSIRQLPNHDLKVEFSNGISDVYRVSEFTTPDCPSVECYCLNELLENMCIGESALALLVDWKKLPNHVKEPYLISGYIKHTSEPAVFMSLSTLLDLARYYIPEINLYYKRMNSSF